MKNYSEPCGRGWDVAEKVMLWAVAVMLCVGVVAACYFVNVVRGVM